MLSSKIKYLILCGLILVFMINLTACDFGRRPTVEEHQVNVSVTTDDDNRETIEGAQIILENTRKYENTTNRFGRVTFNNVREGSYELTATKGGWVAVEGVGSVIVDEDSFYSIQMVEAPFFEVDIINYQTEVTNLGEEFEIEVEVKNTGSVSGEVYIDLFENEFVEDAYVTYKSLVLEPGETDSVILNYEPSDELGIAKFIVKSFNETSGLYDDNATAWGAVLAENSFAVGFDRYEGDTNNFGDEQDQFLDILTTIELNEEDVDEYKIIIENHDQYYVLEHIDGILEFRFRSNNWFDIVVVTEDGDISEAVEGLDSGNIKNITELRVTDFLIWINDDFVNVPDEGVKIVEWSPFDVETDSTGLSESVR